MKDLELYIYNDGSYPTITNKHPVVDADDGGPITSCSDALTVEICEKGLKLFGIKELKATEIARIRLKVESVEIGGREVKVNYKPLLTTPQKSTKKKKT